MIPFKFQLLLFQLACVMRPQFSFGQNDFDASGQRDDIEHINQSLLQRIEGVWISDLVTSEDNSGLPCYTLVIHKGNAILEMFGYGYAKTLSNESYSNLPKEERTKAQRIEDCDSSLYIAWSNERMKVPNQSLAGGLAQSGGDVSYTITKKSTSELFGDSFLGELGSDLVSNMVSGVISSMIYDAFAPTKSINILEMSIHQNNEYELTAFAVIQEIKIKGQEKPLVSKKEQIIHFTKYDPMSGVFFDIPFEQSIYVPGDGSLKVIPKRYEEIGKSFLKYNTLKVPTHISHEIISPFSFHCDNPFNILQNKKLQYYNEQRLYQYPKSKAYLGVQVQVEENKKGCCVSQISPSSPAFLFNIQKGDLIIKIDGYNIDTPEQMKAYIESLKPFEWISICLKRGRKTINLDVELSKVL